MIDNDWEPLETMLLVEWVDSQRFGVEWEPFDELSTQGAIVPCRTVGMLGALTASAITLLLTYDPENDNYNGAISIPRVAIKRVARLYEVEHEERLQLSVINGGDEEGSE